MSTPIKPPGNAPPLAVDGGRALERGRVEGREGELRAMVEEAGADAEIEATGRERSLSGIERDLRTGRIDVDEAIDRLVERALGRAGELSAERRTELEVNLRNALREDPTLIALRKDLERGSS